MGFFDFLTGGGPDEITRTATSEVQIPDFLRPFVEQSTGVASGALSQLQQLSSGPLAAGFSPDQETAFGLARGLALDPGSPLFAAIQQIADTASGEGFNSDEFQNAFDARVRGARPGVISAFGGSSSGLSDVAFERSRADAFAGLFGQERARQQQAALALPGIASVPFGLLSDIGAQQQGQTQRGLSIPLAAQQSLLGSAMGGLPVSSFLGSEQTSTQPLFQNEGAGIAGLLSTGLGIAGSIFGGPIGGALGSGLGGLFGGGGGGPRFGAFGGGS